MGKNFPLRITTTRRGADRRDGSVLACQTGGHTLVELAVAIAIVGILAGIGWTSLQPLLDRYRMMKTARMLHADIQNLRNIAIATNRETRLKLVEADSALDPGEPQVGAWLLQAGNRSSGSSEWDTLPIDDDEGSDDSEGVRDIGVDGGEAALHISLAVWTVLAGPGADNADCVVFTPRGWVHNPPGDFADGYLALTLVNKGSTGRGGDEHATIRISRGGLARIEASEAMTLPANAVGTAEASGQ